MAKVPEMVARARALGQNALAITDHGKMHGVIHFYKECMKVTDKENKPILGPDGQPIKPIKPIIGCEVYVNPNRTFKDPSNKDLFHLVLLAKDNDGYKNLIKIVSDSELVGFYHKPRTDMSVLKRYGTGIIALSACLGGEIPKLLMSGEYEAAKALALAYNDIFDEFYLELQANDTLDQLRLNHLIIQLHEDTGLPLVVTNDAHYVLKEDAPIHEVLLAIQTADVIEDSEYMSDELREQLGRSTQDTTGGEISEETVEKGKKKAKGKKRERFKFDSPNYWLKSEEEVRAILPDYGNYLNEAIENTQKIADACHVEFEFGKNKFPDFPVPKEHTVDSYLAYSCRGALLDMFMSRPDADMEAYYKRLEYELKVIKDQGFSAYFLIEQDFINYAKKNGIKVGPGRGSAAGSLVSNLLGITELDPLGYKTGVELMFERFLVEGRKEPPDIDSDFDPERRNEVIEYVKQKYGPKRVAQIATFGKMGAKTVLKDVGRALGISFEVLNDMTKSIPASLEDPDTGEKTLDVRLEDALEDADKDGKYTTGALALREYQARYPRLFEIAFRLEGIPRQSGIHAAGIIISPVDLDELVPMMRNTEDMQATQFDMKTVAELGLIKYDYLALKTLTVIDNILTSIKRHEGIDVDIHNLPLDDKEVYQLLSRGQTLGVFQVESYMFKELLKAMNPTCFADITAALALGRPGPLDSGMDKVYISNKHGLTQKEYAHPDLEPILSTSEGIILYQEQVMRICQVLAGFTAGEADKVRKAMGKKQIALIKELGVKFMKQSLERGYEERFLNELWAKMETFARYAFNVAHSAAYAMITYRTAWLKVHYPAHFMAATLTNEANSNAKDALDSLKAAVSEAKKLGMQILPPNINESELGFTVAGPNSIRFGLTAIKGIGPKAIEAIMEARPYVSFYDFMLRVNARVCNKKVVNCLIMAGAFDSFNQNRLDLLEEYYANRIEKVPEEIKVDRTISFEVPNEYQLTHKLEWEKSLLGMYVSGHPIEELKLPSWKEARIKGDMETAGTILKVNQIKTKKGDDMAFATIETLDGLLELIIFPKVFDEVSKKLVKGSIVRVKGKRDDENKCIVNSLTNPRLSSLKAIVGGNIDGNTTDTSGPVETELLGECPESA
jgi:DNA polymerase-3 subunit alpha